MNKIAQNPPVFAAELLSTLQTLRQSVQLKMHDGQIILKTFAQVRWRVRWPLRARGGVIL